MTAAAEIAAARRALGPDGVLLLLLGDPVAHSLSPRIHGAALSHHGIAGAYAAVRCPADQLPAAIEAARNAGAAGLNLTAPLKRAVLPLLDELEEDAETVGAVNTVLFEGTRAVGANTDIAGFAGALEERGHEAYGSGVLLLGAGGAARAAALALARLGAARLSVYARRPEQAEALLRDALPDIPKADLRVVTDAADCPADVDLVVNATPLGLGARPDDQGWRSASEALRLLPWTAWAQRPAPPLVFDMNYDPAHTVVMHLAERAGCPHANGLDMLLLQAVESFAMWTGKRTELGILRAALTGR